jgi:hypothetical protein
MKRHPSNQDVFTLPALPRGRIEDRASLNLLRGARLLTIIIGPSGGEERRDGLAHVAGDGRIEPLADACKIDLPAPVYHKKAAQNADKACDCGRQYTLNGIWRHFRDVSYDDAYPGQCITFSSRVHARLVLTEWEPPRNQPERLGSATTRNSQAPTRWPRLASALPIL